MGFFHPAKEPSPLFSVFLAFTSLAIIDVDAPASSLIFLQGSHYLRCLATDDAQLRIIAYVVSRTTQWMYRARSCSTSPDVFANKYTVSVQIMCRNPFLLLLIRIVLSCVLVIHVLSIPQPSFVNAHCTAPVKSRVLVSVLPFFLPARICKPRSVDSLICSLLTPQPSLLVPMVMYVFPLVMSSMICVVVSYRSTFKNPSITSSGHHSHAIVTET